MILLFLYPFNIAIKMKITHFNHWIILKFSLFFFFFNLTTLFSINNSLKTIQSNILNYPHFLSDGWIFSHLSNQHNIKIIKKDNQYISKESIIYVSFDEKNSLYQNYRKINGYQDKGIEFSYINGQGIKIDTKSMRKIRNTDLKNDFFISFYICPYNVNYNLQNIFLTKAVWFDENKDKFIYPSMRLDLKDRFLYLSLNDVFIINSNYNKLDHPDLVQLLNKNSLIKIKSKNSFQNNQWYHIVISYNEMQQLFSLYVNEKREIYYKINRHLSHIKNHYYLINQILWTQGESSWGNNFSGIIDEVRLFKESYNTNQSPFLHKNDPFAYISDILRTPIFYEIDNVEFESDISIENFNFYIRASQEYFFAFENQTNFLSPKWEKINLKEAYSLLDEYKYNEFFQFKIESDNFDGPAIIKKFNLKYRELSNAIIPKWFDSSYYNNRLTIRWIAQPEEIVKGYVLKIYLHVGNQKELIKVVDLPKSELKATNGLFEYKVSDLKTSKFYTFKLYSFYNSNYSYNTSRQMRPIYIERKIFIPANR